MVQASRRRLGRYVLFREIASGGMATVHLARLIGPVGFARTVAIKRLHAHFSKDPEFVAMFLDEARLAAVIQHPNVVPTLDVVATDGELFLVMEYVQGVALSQVLKLLRARRDSVPSPVASSIVSHALYGLHAAHEATSDGGEPLNIVHRDVSPQNILVGADGIGRVADFGVAKAARRIQETESGRVKGKFAYMAPEQIRRDRIDHRVDVFAAGVVLWEALVGRRLFTADEPARVMAQIIEMPIEPPSAFVPELPPELDAVVMRALARNPDERFRTAREMAVALEKAQPPALSRVVGEWLQTIAGDFLAQRATLLAELESDRSDSRPPSLADVAHVLDARAHDATVRADPPDSSPVTDVSAATEPAPRRKRASAALLGAIALGVSLVAISLTLLAVRAEPLNGAGSEPQRSHSDHARSEPPTPPPATPSAQALPSTELSAPSSASAAPRRAPRSTPVRSRPRKPDCTPPYTTDKNGIQVFKPECV